MSHIRDGQAVRDELPAAQAANPLQIAANELAKPVKQRRSRTRDLVGLMLAHGSRAWRSSMPPASIRLAVRTPAGDSAVRLAYAPTA